LKQLLQLKLLLQCLPVDDSPLAREDMTGPTHGNQGQYADQRQRWPSQKTSRDAFGFHCVAATVQSKIESLNESARG